MDIVDELMGNMGVDEDAFQVAEPESEEPAAPAALAELAEPVPAGPRGVADVTVHVPDLGTIKYYARGERMMATCMAHSGEGREQCRLWKSTRDIPGSKYGRPAGFLMLWLKWGNCSCREGHNNQFFKGMVGHARGERLAARNELRLLPNGPDLLACERRQRVEQGEPEEPLDVI